MADNSLIRKLEPAAGPTGMLRRDAWGPCGLVVFGASGDLALQAVRQLI
jgi:hypothetical protein